MPVSRKFHELTVERKERECRDAVRLALAVPDALRDEFEFRPGQHLPFELKRDGKSLRLILPLEVGIRVQSGGQFSEFAANELAVGDTIAVMPPAGRFHAEPDPRNSKSYLGVAAGSGITPVLSIITSILETEPASRCALFYGNRQQSTTMFIEDLYALKNRYPDRLQLHFVFSREEQEFPIAAGRIDAAKARELCDRFCRGDRVDEAFVCGPDTMIEEVCTALVDIGIAADRVHSERFGVPRKRDRGGNEEAPAETGLASVTVIMDGHRKSFDMPCDGRNIVDAAAEQGIELPYSCKGGVCATCRTHVREGEVSMQTNYGLEPWEVDKGYVLACQSRPVTDKVLLDYDKS